MDHIICPHCGERNNPQFTVCWKCRRVFESGELIQPPSDVGASPKRSKKTLGLYIFFAIIFSFCFHTIKTYLQSSPQHVTLSLRQTVLVGRGRAALRLMPDEDKGGGPNVQESVGRMPVVDVKCGTDMKELHSLRLSNDLSGNVCGVRVRVLKVYKGGLDGESPRVDVEVVWSV